MSDTIRIALIAEGITDFEVLRAAVEAMLGGRSFDVKLLQPEESLAFESGNAGPLGGGWKGVYKWCRQAVERSGGSVRSDPLFAFYDILIVHLDADVAGEEPANFSANPPAELAATLPCEEPCPPPHHTTDRLRIAMIAWLGESETPPRTVICTPSKCIEAWVMAIFFPRDREMLKKGWECHPDPASRLQQQPKAARFGKSQEEYRKRSGQIKEGWASVVGKLTEAKRFGGDFKAVVESLPSQVK